MKAIGVILSLLILCGGATASTQRVQYLSVPGLLFSMNIVDVPSAKHGFDKWEAVMVERCRVLGGNYTAEARRFDLNKQPIRTVVVYCWEVMT